MSNTTEQPTPKEEETHKVFIGNLSFTSTEDSLKDFFSNSGDVLESIIIKNGSRPKGYGFVAFRTLEDAEKAVQNCDKKELDGREVSVQIANQRGPRTSAEKKKKNKKSRKSGSGQNNEASNEENTKERQAEEKPKPKTSVFVANLPLDITMMDLTELFKDYQVESALVAIQRSGRSKGYGFVELTTVEEMNKVLNEFVDIEIQGRPIHISAATSEKTSNKPKSVKKTEEESTPAAPATPEKKSRSKKSKKTKETVSAAKNAQESAKVEKKDDRNSAADHANKETVKPSKEKDGASAIKNTKEAKKEDDGISATKNSKEHAKTKKEKATKTSKVAKEDDSVSAVKDSKEAKKDD